MLGGDHGQTSWLVETAAGFCAGVATTVVVHPLDLLKLRLQVDRSEKRATGDSFRLMKRIVKHEGGLRAVYRGFSSNLIGNSVSWALYFMWYDTAKSLLRAFRGERHHLTYYDFFLASGLAGVTTAVCTNPIWVIKTRMLSTAANHTGAYRTTTDGIKRIYNAEGLRGFYRGLTPSLFGVAHGALQFMAYERLKQGAAVDSSGKRQLGNLDYLLFSGSSKAFAGAFTYPYQVVRSRLQIYEADKYYSGVRDVIEQIYRYEGLRGFYKGLGANLVRIVPSSCVTFLVYENTRIILTSPR